jgi:membrane associated rhomboid family serine protease
MKITKTSNFTAGVILVLGFLAAYNFFDAAFRLNSTGDSLTRLKSVGGQTVAEAYYQEIGYQNKSYAAALFGLAFGSIGLSIGLYTVITKSDTNI